jgi:hypothetical protein
MAWNVVLKRCQYSNLEDAKVVENGRDVCFHLTFAQALLIAAAPDLLAACERLAAMNNCNYDRLTEDYQKAMANAKAAIAKAKGI